MMAMSEVGSLTGTMGSGCSEETNAQITIRNNLFKCSFDKITAHLVSYLFLHIPALVTCFVNTILPSRKGGTRLWTSRWTLAALSSSKSSSTSNLWTTPLVNIRLVSHLSLSCKKKYTSLQRYIYTDTGTKSIYTGRHSVDLWIKHSITMSYVCTSLICRFWADIRFWVCFCRICSLFFTYSSEVDVKGLWNSS